VYSFGKLIPKNGTLTLAIPIFCPLTLQLHIVFREHKKKRLTHSQSFSLSQLVLIIMK